MKAILLTILTVGMLGTGCATLESSRSETDWADLTITEDVQLVVHGLSCPLCASNLDQHLLRIDGVSDMWVDLQTGQVQVEIESGMSVSGPDLNRAVRNAGFTLRGIHPRDEAL